MDICDGQLRVNQRPITVCGANVHEMHPTKGKAITEVSYDVIELFNIEMITIYYDICDYLCFLNCYIISIEILQQECGWNGLKSNAGGHAH